MRLILSALALTFALCISASADPLPITGGGAYVDRDRTAGAYFTGEDFSVEARLLVDEGYSPRLFVPYGKDADFGLGMDNGSAFSFLHIKTPKGDFEWETDMDAYSALAIGTGTVIRRGVNSYSLPFSVEFLQQDIGLDAVGSGTVFVKGFLDADGFNFLSATYKIGVTPTPEPATIIMIVTGLGALGVRRRLVKR